MSYTRKTVGLPAAGAGNPSPKSPTIQIFEVGDIATYPTREVGVTTAAEGFAFITGKEPIAVYATPSTIEILQEAEGDADARGYKKGVKFDHPGNSTDIEDFIEYHSNKNLIAVVSNFSGTKQRIIGSPDNPLSLKAENQDTKDGAKNTITLQQDIRDEFRILWYTGEITGVSPESI